jgi:hypothetical protein
MGKNNSDSARAVYEKYLGLANPEVEIILKSGRCIRGAIVGYYSRDGEGAEVSVDRWHIAGSADNFNACIDTFGFLRGEIVRHCDIATIIFLEDKSRMKF